MQLYIIIMDRPFVQYWALVWYQTEPICHSNMGHRISEESPPALLCCFRYSGLCFQLPCPSKAVKSQCVPTDTVLLSSLFRLMLPVRLPSRRRLFTEDSPPAPHCFPSWSGWCFQFACLPNAGVSLHLTGRGLRRFSLHTIPLVSWTCRLSLDPVLQTAPLSYIQLSVPASNFPDKLHYFIIFVSVFNPF